MESREAIQAMAALAQDTRLDVFRYLVAGGPQGRAAGEIAEALGTAPATLSYHLGLLERAGLLHARRASRQIYYAADVGSLRRLLGFLTADCCGGRPETCNDAGELPDVCVKT